LIPELLRHLLAERADLTLVNQIVRLTKRKRLTELVVWKTLHSDQNATPLPRLTGPTSHQVVERLPAAQVEVADGEIGSDPNLKRIAQIWKELIVDIVEDPRHATYSLSMQDGWDPAGESTERNDGRITKHAR